MTAPRMRASTKAATRRDEDQLVQRAIAVLERRMFRRGQELRARAACANTFD
ncbi:hypothetical protein P4054_23125 [Pseudomonas aeruginosa]|nr:hypothetical protein [Pseudomonas aeruginosa]